MKVRSARAGSKRSGRWTMRPISASTCRTGATSSCPFEVGSIPRAVRSRSGSAKSARSRPSAALVADCESSRRAAARVTLRSDSSASSATSRLRSIVRMSIGGGAR